MEVWERAHSGDGGRMTYEYMILYVCVHNDTLHRLDLFDVRFDSTVTSWPPFLSLLVLPYFLEKCPQPKPIKT